MSLPQNIHTNCPGTQCNEPNTASFDASKWKQLDRKFSYSPSVSVPHLTAEALLRLKLWEMLVWKYWFRMIFKKKRKEKRKYIWVYLNIMPCHWSTQHPLLKVTCWTAKIMIFRQYFIIYAVQYIMVWKSFVRITGNMTICGNVWKYTWKYSTQNKNWVCKI